LPSRPKIGSVNQIGTVGLHHDIVRRVQPLAAEAIDQHRDRSVIFGAHHAAAAMLAGDQPTLAVAGIAVGEVRRLAEDADRAGLFLPFQDALVRDVAAQQIAAVAEPHRAFGPAQAGGDAFHGGELQPVLLEARIERMDRGIRVIGRGTPAGGMNIGHLLFSLLCFLCAGFAIIVGLRPQFGRSKQQKRGTECHVY